MKQRGQHLRFKNYDVRIVKARILQKFIQRMKTLQKELLEPVLTLVVLTFYHTFYHFVFVTFVDLFR